MSTFSTPLSLEFVAEKLELQKNECFNALSDLMYNSNNIGKYCKPSSKFYRFEETCRHTSSHNVVLRLGILFLRSEPSHMS